MKARRFNHVGLDAFTEYVARVRAENERGVSPVDPVPRQLLSDPSLSDATSFDLPSVDPKFADKREIGGFFAKLIPGSEHETVRWDAGFWSWMAARYFDSITKQRTKIKEERAYVAGLTFREFYRHLLLGPYYLYFMAQDDPRRVDVLLYDEPTTMNEVMVQFGSYQTLMQNRALQQVIQRLYYDTARKRIKRGAGGKEAGTPRRLMDFFRQIELNYDLVGIKADQFWQMLPKEFDRFK